MANKKNTEMAKFEKCVYKVIGQKKDQNGKVEKQIKLDRKMGTVVAHNILSVKKWNETAIEQARYAANGNGSEFFMWIAVETPKSTPKDAPKDEKK